MTFRIEEKVIIYDNNINKLRNWLNKNNFSILHPDRIIKSLYFDNESYDMYSDSEEGCVPRKKIRIRNYPNLNLKLWNLEKKISAIEGRFKTSEKITSIEYSKYINNGYFYNYYVMCKPRVIVEYNRKYFSNKIFRITIDTNIKCNFFKNKLKFKDNLNVLEFKSSNLNLKNWIFENTFFVKTRFSKYSRSFDFNL